jgi:hypothetical protein
MGLKHYFVEHSQMSKWIDFTITNHNNLCIMKQVMRVTSIIHYVKRDNCTNIYVPHSLINEI